MRPFRNSFSLHRYHESRPIGPLDLDHIARAEALRGTALTVPRSELPPLGEGEYYHADLIGLPAVSTAGEALGVCVAVENFGAGDVIEIERPDGARFMVPMRVEAVPEWMDHIVICSDYVL